MMLQNLIAALKSNSSNDVNTTRRRHPRRANDRCVVVIYGHTFPVEDWSFGGVQLAGDDRLFGSTQTLDFTLKFKVRNTILDVHHRGRVVRKGHGRVALEFEPLTQTIRQGFQRVIDDAIASEFAESQV